MTSLVNPFISCHTYEKVQIIAHGLIDSQLLARMVLKLMFGSVIQQRIGFMWCSKRVQDFFVVLLSESVNKTDKTIMMQ